VARLRRGPLGQIVTMFASLPVLPFRRNIQNGSVFLTNIFLIALIPGHELNSAYLEINATKSFRRFSYQVTSFTNRRRKARKLNVSIFQK
jgi:hypothetical protein